MKSLVRKIIESTDRTIALFLSRLLRTKTSESRVLLIPAGDINGGFGEDVMVAGFLNICDRPITLLANTIEKRQYINEKKDVSTSTVLNKRLKYLRVLRLLSVHSDVFVIGADILDGVYSNNKTRFNILTMAHNMGVCTHITSFSVREKSSRYFVNKITETSSYTKIMARDYDSHQRLQMMIKTIAKDVIPDIAFACNNPLETDSEVYEWCKEQRAKKRRIVAYCPNTIQARNMGLNIYKEIQEQIIKVFLNNNCSVIFLYHDLRKYALGISDLELSKMIYSDLDNELSLFVNGIKDGYSLKKYIAFADMTLTGRMHFGISGYTLGVPMFGISYFGKFEGLQKMFGIEPCKSLIPSNSTLIDNSVIENFICEIDEMKKKVSAVLPNIVEKCYNNVQ